MNKFVYNRKTLSYEEPRQPKWRPFVRFLVTAALAAAVVAAFSWLWFIKLHKDLPKTAMLKLQIDAWEARMEVLNHKLDVYQGTLAGIEARNDDVYRLIFGLDPVVDTLAADSTAVLPMQHLGARINEFQSRIAVQQAALADVSDVARKAGDMVLCIPAVPPILPQKSRYHLSSPFGVRTDPVYGGTARHTGVDFAAKIGYPIYATGEGTVEKVDFKHRGYGNEILIDHGFGYKTRYAHLSSVNVGVGQTVHRGDKIGEIGKSGKATGPHLHYEVLYKDSPVNPMSFMDLTMPVEEYRAMIKKRREESRRPPVSAASLGERQRKQGTNGRQ